MPLQKHKAELVLDTKSILGEGPVWDWKKQTLFWVDIEGQKLHRLSPTPQNHTEWVLDAMVGAAVPMKEGKLLLAMESGLVSFDLESEVLTTLHVLENTDQSIRFNDGKVGPDGDFWVGTMDKGCAPKRGNFYRVDTDFNATLQIPKTSVSNGMAWSSDKKTLYYIDSPTFEVRAFDFKNGGISNAKVAIHVPKDYGSPDGMCIDAEGMLWIAHWGGLCVRCWNPETGEVLEVVKVDAPHVTSCCFGGKDLDTLYITTARSGLNEKQLLKYPLSGGLFSHRPKVKGAPITHFKGKS
ncbi:SMP-30/gluconolactonase/LRE family protein [Pareuzebyella sediminis]|uniref:SMP-30/gluconolactonase/LRE family protein n=1 Tax=Pareuzebyella sediminis TaxID=2607998 RepID=UPI0018E17AFF|nr:SMP-30/gluconolactonase/LRE family protein [Pareuzebyella sediminis]